MSARLPEQAQAAFDEVLRQDPRHPQALYGRAMLAMNRGDLASALRFFDRAVEANPGFVEARRYRAVVLSRQGDWDPATRDINWCLDRDPRSGETLYAAACVAARAAEAAPSPRALDQAFDLLARAWSLGSGRRAHEDPDLAVLRRDPRFTRLMATTLGTDHCDRRRELDLTSTPAVRPPTNLFGKPSMLALHNAPARGRSTITADRVKALSRVLREEFSIPFSFYDGSTGEPLDDRHAGEAPSSHPGELPAEVLAIAARGRPHVSLGSNEHFRLVLPIQEGDGTMLIAIGDLPALAQSHQAARLEQARLQKWLQAVHSRLSFPGDTTHSPRNDQAHLQQFKTLLEASRELTDLLGDLKSLGESNTDPGRILQRVAVVLPVETLIWVPAQADETVAIEGDRCLSAREGRELARWLAKSPDWDRSGCLLVNQAASSGLGARFPGIINLMALSGDDRNSSGCLIALNKTETMAARSERSAAPTHPPRADRPAIVPFRHIDVALLKPFASLLGLQSRSSRRQSQVQELFAGLISSLTAAIDAKDSYTCGHSERVARIAVELGRELSLSESELGDIYLAGLLHDIGKIGIPDSLLGKRASLTSEEFLQVSQHVLIGCRILEGFGGISHLLPSVLSHHERYDGAGYPHGLKGEAIPLLARILAVADCYDAMSTARPYRAALARDQIEETLAQGRDSQWDGEVIDAFFRARERIYAIHPRGVGDSVWFALNAPGGRISPGSSGPLVRPVVI